MGLECVLLRLHGGILSRIDRICQVSNREVPLDHDVSSIHIIPEVVAANPLRIIWAIILTCHAAASSFAGITTLRVLLGVFESAISPGFTIVVGMWYTPSEHALRSCIWFAGNGVASIFGGVLSYAIGHVHNRLGPWQVYSPNP